MGRSMLIVVREEVMSTNLAQREFLMGLLEGIGVMTMPLSLMDNIICWNVRGLNEGTGQFDVKNFLRSHKVSIAGLLETRVRECNFSRFIRNFDGWEHVNNYDMSPNGRLLVIWKKEFVTVHCLARSSQMVHCLVKFNHGDVSCYITFVYAANKADDRKPLWDDLMTVGVEYYYSMDHSRGF